MRKRIPYLLLLGWLLLSLSARAQDADGTGIDEATRLEIQARLDQFLESMDDIRESCMARLPVSDDIQFTEGYVRMIDHKLQALDRNLRLMEIRWNSYYPVQQWEISQDEGLMNSVVRFELLRQDAADSLAVRQQMLQSLQDFIQAKAYMEGIDSSYNSLGKRAFELSLTSKTAPLLEKEKKKEQILFAAIQEKFDKAKEAERLKMVSSQRMGELEDMYAALKNKSDAIQQMAYKPLIQRLKDYLLSLAAVAVLLMFVSMIRAKIKAAKELRKNMKKYKESLHLNGQDDYPTI